MNKDKPIYIAIDLKSFYASVECMERKLDPLTTHLVVADASRTEKTICLAVSPSLKAYGVSGRPRLFEVVQKVKQINQQRKAQAPNHAFSDKSSNDIELKIDPSLKLDYIVAPPRMAYYMDYSKRIYEIYLKYFAPEDIHVYSIDEVMIYASPYLKVYQLTAHELTKRVLQDVKQTTGITATAGIGTNLYLCKVAMDIRAKHIPADEDGVRIAELDELSYRQNLWQHRPLTDFWRVGKGYAGKLEAHGLFTMGDIARCSLGRATDYYNEELLYRLFGVNAELLIDHAWGIEPCTLKEIKSYRPKNNSLGSGQVLSEPYTYEKAKIVVYEMADLLALEMVDKKLICDQIILTIGYDIENLKRPEVKAKYQGEIKTDTYGRKVPKSAHGSINLGRKTASAKLIVAAAMELLEQIINPNLWIRRLNIVANHVELASKKNDIKMPAFEQIDLFHDYEAEKESQKQEEADLKREQKIQEATIAIKKKYGKNAILKGINLEDGATARLRNRQIGGHRA